MSSRHSLRWRHFLFGLLALVELALIYLDARAIGHIATPLDGHFQDLTGRMRNLDELRHTGNIYQHFATEAFTYPPGAILLFWPWQFLSAATRDLLWTMLSLVSLVGTVAIALRRVVFWEWTPLLLASGLLALVTSWCCNPVLSGLQWGQTALLLQLLVVADLLVVSRHGRGVFVGVASAIKLFPALFLVVFALRRDWRPLRLALIAAGVMTAASTLIWPRSSWYFLIHVLLSGQEVSHFDTTSNLVNDTSIAALFNRPPFFHGSEPHTLRFVLCAAVVVWGLALAQRAWRRGFEVTAVVTVLVVDAAGLPNAWIHYYAFVPLLFVTAFEWRAGPQRTLLLAEAIGLCFPFVYFRTAAGSGPLHNVLFQLICDADALLLLGYLVLASWHLVTSKPMANRRRTSSRGERNDRWTPPRR